MGDPELRSDEVILLRTQGIYVKSIPFEGILTNKRIILIDRATNLLPQREIPLVTLKDFEPGENAIRDQIITLSVLAKTGETRQMVLTFSRRAGGTRIKDRDEWLKVLKENISSSFEQVVRRIVPGLEQVPKKSVRAVSPRIEVISSPMLKNAPPATKTSVKKEVKEPSPTKKIIEARPVPDPLSTVAKEHDISLPTFGTYCSRCGNRVPEGSGFCNRCGSRIVVPENIVPPGTAEAVPIWPSPIESAETIQPFGKDREPIPPFTEYSADRVPADSLGATPQESETPENQIYDVQHQKSIPSVSDEYSIVEKDDKPELSKPVITTSQLSGLAIPADQPRLPHRPKFGFNIKPGKKAIIGIVVIIIIIAVVVGVFFLYPMISNGGLTTSNDNTANTTVSAGADTSVIAKETTKIVSTKTTTKPTATVTYSPVPGNSAANVGL